MPTLADLAQHRFELLLPELKAFAERNWSESDTRSKLIDRVFVDVLGWSEQHIVREKPVHKGYADYVFVAESFRHFHVEAKKGLPRWNLHAPPTARRMRLSGPHLLRNKEIRKDIEQTQEYSSKLGTGYAVLTNGTQFVVFRSIVIGHDWRSYDALCWHSLEDIAARFGEFYGLLSQECVTQGSLRARFSDSLLYEDRHRPAEFSGNADAEYVRNPFWAKISSTIGPLLTDAPGETELSETIIRNCYVQTPLSDQVDTSLNELLKDRPSRAMENAGVIDLRPGMYGDTAFGFRIKNDLAGNAASSTYIITGGVGCGKTTFLRRYASVVSPEFVRRQCVWIAVDFLPIGSVDPAQQSSEIRRFAFAEARKELKTRVDHYPQDGEGIRKLFQPEVTESRKTKLFGVEKSSAEARDYINGMIDDLWKNDELVVTRLLKRSAELGKRPVVVFDNTDQLGEPAQEAVFLLAQRVARECVGLSVVALREEKFFAAYRRGVFDAFGDRRFHIGSPDLANVIRRRLDFGISSYETRSTENGTDADESRDVVQVLRCLIRSTTSSNSNIVRYLSCVSNGDMRYALSVFRDFVSSGNTDVSKIQKIVREYGGYTVPFHEFAKSAILGSRRYFQSSTSHVVNLFIKSNVLGASHLTAVRLLARLAASQTSSSVHGEGYLDCESLQREWDAMFGRVDDLSARAEELIRRNLVETEPPRQTDLMKVDALRISASGAYYWKYLVRSFAYLDLVYFDTPLADRDLAKKLAAMSSTTDMQVRFDRVREFMDYLGKHEELELGMSMEHGNTMSSLLVPKIREQIEDEFEWIRHKLRDPSLE